MVSPNFFFFLSLLPLTFAQPELYHVCSGNGNYTANSLYQSNLDLLLTSLTSETTDYTNGVLNLSAGEVNSIVLCRGDVKPHLCRSCLNNSRYALTELCPNQKEAIGWYDFCMLRYSNRSIFGIAEKTPTISVANGQDAAEAKQFENALSDLFSSLTYTAASGDSLLKFAMGISRGSSFETVYGLVQCTPDLSELECRDCLSDAFDDRVKLAIPKIGGIVLKPSCNLRYEIAPFYGDIANSPPPQSPPGPINTQLSKGRKSNATKSVIIILAHSVITLPFIILASS